MWHARGAAPSERADAKPTSCSKDENGYHERVDRRDGEKELHRVNHEAAACVQRKEDDRRRRNGEREPEVHRVEREPEEEQPCDREAHGDGREGRCDDERGEDDAPAKAAPLGACVVKPSSNVCGLLRAERRERPRYVRPRTCWSVLACS